jgi:hypothetical protein
VCSSVDLRGPATNGITGDFIPASDNLGTNNASSRASASRWNEKRDPEVKSALRGRY